MDYFQATAEVKEMTQVWSLENRCEICNRLMPTDWTLSVCSIECFETKKRGTKK